MIRFNGKNCVAVLSILECAEKNYFANFFAHSIVGNSKLLRVVLWNFAEKTRIEEFKRRRERN